MKPAMIFASLALAACSTPKPAVEVRTVEVPVEVQRPCPAEAPQRPAKLARPLPTDANALAAVLAAKLIEWAGTGGYGDQAEAYFEACPPE